MSIRASKPMMNSPSSPLPPKSAKNVVRKATAPAAPPPGTTPSSVPAARPSNSPAH